MFALATVVMASCSDNDTWNEENGPDPSKELISFSSQDGQIGTRAVFEVIRAGLHSSNDTMIVMRIMAENSETTSGHTMGANRYTRIVATASKEKKNNVCHSASSLFFVIHFESELAEIASVSVPPSLMDAHLLPL